MGVLFPKKVTSVSMKTIKRGSVLGFLLFLAIWTQTAGLQLTTATRSGFLTALYVPFTPLLAWVCYRQKMFPRQFFVTFVAMGGLYILTNQGQLSNSLWFWLSQMNRGDLWTIATAFVSALHIVVTEKYSREEPDSLALGLWQFLWCTFWVSGTALWNSRYAVPFASYSWNLLDWPFFALGSVFFNAIVSTCFGFVMQIVAQKTVGSLKAALIFALEAPFASGFAYVFLGELMTPREFVGALIVFLTGIIPEGWLKSKQS